MSSNFQIKLRSDFCDFIAFFRAHCHPILYQQILSKGSAEFALALFYFFKKQNFDSSLSNFTLGTIERSTTDIHTKETQTHPFSHCVFCVFDSSFDILGIEAAEAWAQSWLIDTQQTSTFSLKEHQTQESFHQVIQNFDSKMLQQISTLIETIYPLWINTK